MNAVSVRVAWSAAALAVPADVSRAVARHAARQIRLGALLVAITAASMSALVAGQYQSFFAGALDQESLRALAANPAIRILLGPPVALDDPGGFTVWRTGTPVHVLVAVWALLAATRITRGEEDSGRADLLLSGRLRPIDLMLRCLAVMAGASVVIGAAVAVALLATGTAPAGALLHGTGITAVALAFAAAGMLAAQILPTRSSAVGLTVAALGVWLLLRMLANGVDQLAWLSWLSPFGLTAQAAPYADNRALPLLALAAFPVVLAAGAIVTGAHRDIGSGLFNPPGQRRPRTKLLRSVTGFATRRAIRPTIAWSVGLCAYFLLVGALTQSILRFLQDNARFAALAAFAGFTKLDVAEGFAAAMFSLLAIPAGLYAVTRIAAMAADETAGRWTALLALPVARVRIVLTETVVTAIGALVVVTLAGLALWAGTFLTDAPLGVTAALSGAWNVAPVAWLSLGAAVLALGWAPRVVAVIGSLPVAGGFLLQVTTQSTTAPSWVGDLSPFAHLAAVPAAPPDWPSTTTLTAIAAFLAAFGVFGYSRRDPTT